MILGFHYHIPAFKNNGIFTTAYIGVFLDSIAKECEKVICFLHSPIEEEMPSMDYKIKSTNIELINIGPHDQLYYRLLRSKVLLKSFKNSFDEVDVLIVRAPTPLIFQLNNLFNGKLVLYVVGSYVQGAKELHLNYLKNFLIKLYSHQYEYRQRKLIKGNKTIVNSRLLLKQFSKLSKGISEIKSTTLSNSDFYDRKDTCQNKKNIRILFTGRIDPYKGVFEILEACNLLIGQGYQVEFHIAGIEIKGLGDVPNKLMDSSKKFGIEDCFKYHGRLKLGKELNDLYRSSDIYVIASKGDFEGFPRTIWEAMANSIPVVATKVGSIPYFLNHEENSLLIDPNSVDDIVLNIKRLLEDPSLRQRIIKNGFKLAKKNTLETQAKKMINQIKDFIK